MAGPNRGRRLVFVAHPKPALLVATALQAVFLWICAFDSFLGGIDSPPPPAESTLLMVCAAAYALLSIVLIVSAVILIAIPNIETLTLFIIGQCASVITATIETAGSAQFDPRGVGSSLGLWVVLVFVAIGLVISLTAREVPRAASQKPVEPY
jgi:hypothetical protein